VFILLGLRGALFVSVVSAGLTAALFGENDKICDLRVDSIGVTRRRFAHLGSADSKGVTRAFCIERDGALDFQTALMEALDSPANMPEGGMH